MTGFAFVFLISIWEEYNDNRGYTDLFLYRKQDEEIMERKQRAAMTDLKVLAYFSMLAMEQKCILPKQYEQIARQASDCQNLLGAWMNSDRKRLQP